MAPGLAISENFGDLLDARFRKLYNIQTAEAIKEAMVPMLFNVMSQSSGPDYRVSGIGGMGDVPDFDGSITYDTFGQLYDKTISFPEKALGFKVERKLADDDLFDVVDDGLCKGLDILDRHVLTPPRTTYTHCTTPVGWWQGEVARALAVSQ